MQDRWRASEELDAQIHMVRPVGSGSEEMVTYTHVTVPPVERDVDVPPVVADLLAHTDGAALFCPVGTDVDDLGLDYEAVLFDAAEIHQETARLRELLSDEIAEVDDDLHQLGEQPEITDEVSLRRSIDSIWTIGRTVGGDSLVIETWDSTKICVYTHQLLLSNLLWPKEVVRCDALRGLFDFLADRLTNSS